MGGCSYQLQKYRDAATYIVPLDPENNETWGDSEHRLAQIAETTVIHKNVVEVRHFSHALDQNIEAISLMLSS